jgi:hypothetical protein
LIKLEIPKTVVSLKEPKIGDNDSFLITYEYAWSKSIERTDAPEYVSQQTIDASLDSLPRNFSAAISFSFKSVRRIRNGYT